MSGVYDAEGYNARLEWRSIYKLLAGCHICGYARCASALELHHRDPATKSFKFGGESWSYAWDRIEAELALCDVTCANCHREQPRERKGGLTPAVHTAPAARRAQERDRAYRAEIHEHRREWLDVFKLLSGCQVCGYARDPVALTFHHRDPATKLFNIGASIGGNRNWDTVLAEIEKCDLICECCHREHEEAAKSPPWGPMASTADLAVGPDVGSKPTASTPRSADREPRQATGDGPDQPIASAGGGQT